MINIHIGMFGDSARFALKGHAGYAESGKDIVCAGVSVLTSCLANMAREFKERGVTDDCVCIPEDSPTYIVIKSGDPAVKAAVETIADMYGQLALQYPEYIDLTIEQVVIR